MPIFIPAIKWLFSKVFLISLISVIIVGSYLVKKSAITWFDKQEARALEAQQIFEEAKDRAGPQYLALQKQISSTKEEISIQLQNLANTAEAIKALNGKWKGIRAFWLPLDGYDEDDWNAEQDKLRKNEQRAAAAKAEAEKQLSALITNLKLIQENLPDNQDLINAQKTAERELEEFDDRKRIVNDFNEDAQQAWSETKKIIVATIAIVILGPLIWKIFCFWVFGGLAIKCRFFYLSKTSDQVNSQPSIGESQPALKIPLTKGDTLVVKERFLQASKEMVSKKTEYVWNWKYPILSLIAGLVFLTKIRVAGDQGVITLSCDDDPALEVIRVDLKEDDEVAIRPGFLVGYLFTSEPLKIRVIWNFGLQSWLTLKFRSFLVKGKGSIFLSAGRGFNDEQIDSSLIVDRDIPALWSPWLGFRARRAETFWSYALGRNALFDDEFSGKGRVLCQQVRGFNGGRTAESIWGRVLGVLGKIIGL
ncbi:AIM24 family protein [Verrucomicrobiaceae bacterium 227]